MKILCTQLGRIGDMILNTGALQLLKDKHPEVVIDFICSRHNYSIIENNPAINKIFIYDKSPISLISFIFNIRNINYDYYIDFKDHKSSESQLLSRIVKSECKIGFNTKYFNIDFTQFIKQQVHFAKKAEIALASTGLIQVSSSIPKPVLYSNTIDELRFVSFQRLYAPNGYICINISATTITRTISVSKWKLILEKLSQYYNCILISAPSDKPVAEEIASHKSYSNVYYYQTTAIAETYPVIKESQFIVTPDTSVVHIASAFSIKCFCFYQLDTYNITRFAPLTEGSVIVSPEISAEHLDTITIEYIYEQLGLFIKNLSL